MAIGFDDLPTEILEYIFYYIVPGSRPFDLWLKPYRMARHEFDNSGICYDAFSCPLLLVSHRIAAIATKVIRSSTILDMNPLYVTPTTFPDDPEHILWPGALNKTIFQKMRRVVLQGCSIFEGGYYNALLKFDCRDATYLLSQFERLNEIGFAQTRHVPAIALELDFTHRAGLFDSKRSDLAPSPVFERKPLRLDYRDILVARGVRLAPRCNVWIAGYDTDEYQEAVFKYLDWVASVAANEQH